AVRIRGIRGGDARGEHVAGRRIDDNAGQALLAGAGEESSWIEVKQSRGVVAYRKVARDDFDDAIQFCDVEVRIARERARVRHEGNVRRQLQTPGDDVDLVPR